MKKNEMIKKIIPYHIKIKLHELKNIFRDIFKGYYFNYAKRKQLPSKFLHTLKIRQDLKPNDTKKNNLLIAIKSIESVEINPNEIFSFWKIVGNPSSKKGYLESRSLVNNQLEKSIGGGLCQLSGLIYYISLHAKLEVLERYSHSMDIYTNENRFTPLGSDATVVYGYKDLKIRNNLNHPIKFTFLMEENHITIQLNHSSLIENNKVDFKENILDDNRIEVVTIINQEKKGKSIYKRYVPNTIKE